MTFRLLTFVVMTGVLVLAAGVPRAAGEDHNFWIVVIGYVIMRVAMIPLWLRVAREHVACRSTALRYVGAVALLQMLWILRAVFLDDGTWTWVSFVVLAMLEMAGPVWAERAGRTPWHRHHIAERYELFTIIVLGEVILATTQAISGALDDHGLGTQLVLLIIGGLLIVFSMWWIYFKRPMVDSVRRETSFVFGYGHGFLYMSIAAIGACLATLVDVAEHKAHVEPRNVVLLLVAAASIYLLVIAGVHALADPGLLSAAPAVVLVVVFWVVGLVGSGPGTSVLLIGLAMALSLADHLRRTNRAASTTWGDNLRA